MAMANTYTQIYIQFVFAVKYRNRFISTEIKDQLEKYITGIIQSKGSKLISIYAMPDHIHILVGLHPTNSLSELAREIKSSSSKWMNQKFIQSQPFQWQKGYGAFSYSKSQLDRVVKYIENQPVHHKQKTFREEYLQLLERFDIDFKPEYVFEPPIA